MKVPADVKGKEVVFDASGAVVGRLCAYAAKLSLSGANVRIANIEQAVFSGKKAYVVGKYAKRRHMTQKSNPEEAAKWPRRPDYFFKAVLRGMLPKRSSTGKLAASRIMAYIGVPAGLDISKALKIPDSDRRAPATITILEVCRNLGWNK
jgi:ribosomal protein uL13